MIILDCEQRSQSWYAARLGIPTASNFSAIVTAKGNRSAQREKYMVQLAKEKITGKIEQLYCSSEMAWGIQKEGEARAMFEYLTDLDTKLVGICLSDDKTFGCSPDALIHPDGGLEIKCPQENTHIEYLRKGKLPSAYIQQVYGSMLVTGYKWWYFLSYHPEHEPLVLKIKRNESYMSKMYKEIKLFCEDLEYLVQHFEDYVLNKNKVAA